MKNLILGFKNITHALAVLAGFGVTWALSDQGQSVIGGIVKAYPKASFITTLVTVLALLYHKSAKPPIPAVTPAQEK